MTYKYFSEAELQCHCGCGSQRMEDEFMHKIVAIREKIGKQFNISSAFRCPSHNASVSKTGLNGPHTTGRAIDIICNSRLRSEILHEATKLGMSRFGIAKWGIHIDDLTDADNFDTDVIWIY